MLTIDLHRATIIKILKEIYTDSDLRTLLGFKGGTAARLFYDLPRFSVDLDFDLLTDEKKDVVFTKLNHILVQFGRIDEAYEKHYTLFFLLNYQKRERNLKVEISKRTSAVSYEVKQYLGIAMLVMKQEDMAAAKLSALLTRKRFAARDVFDLWFFLKHNWVINEIVVKEQTGLSLPKALRKAEKVVKELKKTQLLSGVGDLLDNEQKVWVKDKLQDDLVFLLKLYASSYTFKAK